MPHISPLSVRPRNFRAVRLNAVLGLAAFAAVCFVSSPVRATGYYWDADGDTTTDIGGTGPWDTTSLLWRLSSPTGSLTAYPAASADNDAFLLGNAGTLTLGTAIDVNDLTVAPTTGTAYTVTGAFPLTFDGAARSNVSVASGASLTITSGLAGANGFNKTTAGTLILDSALGSSNLTGAISVTGGTLQAGSTANNAASQVLRSNAVDLAAGTTLTTAGTTTDLRVGTVTGSGSITPATGGAVNILALSDGTFSGAVTTTGGLTLRGGNGTTQTFNGNLTALTGTIGVNSGATFALSGTGDATSGVLGSLALAPRGGTILLDNTAGNTGAAAGRIADAAAVTFVGGTLSLVGNSAGTSETVGNLTLNGGAATINVTSNSTTAPTTLTFTDTGSLRDSTAMTVNFTGTGGTLGAGGNNPAILFTGTPFTGTGGLLANSAGGSTIGFATVNGTEWAGYSATNGIVPVAPTLTTGTNTGLQAATGASVTVFNPSASQTLTAGVTTATLKLAPTAAGLSLATGSNAVSTTAVMLAGTTDFSITGTGQFANSGSGTRYFYVSDANTTLSIANPISSASPFNKSGAGYMNLNGAANQIAFAANQNINVLQGVLRGTTTSLGGGTTSAAGAFTTTNLYGGAVEIAGGGSFIRALNLAGTTAGGGLKWDGGGTARGDGGFSAIGGEAVVSLVTTVGGATAATPVWNSGGFVSNGYALLLGSTKSDSRVVFTNNIGLDDGTAASNYFGREIRVTTGVAGSSARLSGVLTGSSNADLLKTGTGTLELTGTNTYAGNTLVQQGALQVGSVVGTGAGNGQLASTGKIIVNPGGTLLLGGTSASADRLNNAASVVLAGGTFNTGGLSEGSVTGGTPTAGVGALTLTANSILDLGSGASILAFANSSAQAFNGTLSIYNWSGNTSGGGTDQVFFGFDLTGLTAAQLNNVLFYSGAGTGFLGNGGILSNGEVVPVAVPEPATAVGGLLMVGLLGWSQRRRLSAGLKLA